MPFGTPEYSRTPMEQDRLDSMLAARMENAGRGGGVVVRVGRALLASQDDLHCIMERVARGIPGAKPRVHSSYALLLLCTLKVSHNPAYLHMLYILVLLCCLFMHFLYMTPRQYVYILQLALHIAPGGGWPSSEV